MPPAFATATERLGGQAPAIGASRTGRLNPYSSQNLSARTRGRPPLLDDVVTVI
jgi:hypothetical protein